MNILFFSELFYPHGGGAELATYLYAKLLSEEGINVMVVTNKFKGETDVSRIKNLTIYRVPLFLGNKPTKYSLLARGDILFSNFLRKLIKLSDVVYVPRFWYSAIVQAKLHQKPVIVHLHDFIAICPLSNLYNTCELRVCWKKVGFGCSKCIYTWERIRDRNLFEIASSTLLNSTLGLLWENSIKLSDAIICVSQTQKEIISHAKRSIRAKLHMIYNPLPEISYTAAKERDFAYFGGPNRLKGFDVLCTALKLIKQRVHDHVRVHATGFNNISDFEMASMHKLGFVPYRRLEKEEFVKLYEHIRCVVVPSIWLETFSYVMIEALLAERIVVASELGAIPEVSRGCKGLFLCPPGDSTVLSEKLLEVRDMSEEVAADLGSRNREKIIERFSNRESTLRFISVLDQVSSH